MIIEIIIIVNNDNSDDSDHNVNNDNITRWWKSVVMKASYGFKTIFVDTFLVSNSILGYMRNTFADVYFQYFNQCYLKDSSNQLGSASPKAWPCSLQYLMYFVNDSTDKDCRTTQQHCCRDRCKIPCWFDIVISNTAWRISGTVKSTIPYPLVKRYPTTTFALTQLPEYEYLL